MEFIRKAVCFMKEKIFSSGVFLPILFVLVLAVGMICNSGSYPETYYGKPTVSYDHPDLHKSNIEQVLVDGTYMYILPHHSNGIVQVCHIDGEYAYTLFFYENINGYFSMAMDGASLYVRDMKGNVYEFQNGHFVEFLSKTDAEQQLSHVDLRSGVSSPGYEIRSNSIWMIADGKEICLVATEEVKLRGVWWLLCGGFCLVLTVKLCGGLLQKRNKRTS